MDVVKITLALIRVIAILDILSKIMNRGAQVGISNNFAINIWIGGLRSKRTFYS